MSVENFFSDNPGGRPAFSPDGKYITFDVQGGGSVGGAGSVWIADFKTRTATPSNPRLFIEATPPAAPGLPAGFNGLTKWSPDGSHILFHSARDHQPLHPGGGAGGGAPGEELYVGRVVYGKGGPRVEDQVRLTEGPPGETNFHGVWSPDGKRIAWVRHLTAACSGT